MLRHHPKRGEVLKCEFSGLKPPEMCKTRPVIIVSVSAARPQLAILVPVSTTPPLVSQPWHHKLSSASTWEAYDLWVKCDMIYAMRFSRLSLWGLGRDNDGKRIYLKEHYIAAPDMDAIKTGIRAAIGP